MESKRKFKRGFSNSKTGCDTHTPAPPRLVTAPIVQTALDEAAALYQAGKYAEALARAEQALSINPASVPLLNVAAASAHSTGRIDLAERYLRTAVEVQPMHADAHNNLGFLFHEIGCFDEAEAAYRQAIALRPAHVMAYCNLGNLCQQLKRFEEAEAAYRRAVALQPANGFCNLGTLYMKLKRFDEAEAAFCQALVKQPDNPDVQRNLSLLLLTLGRFEEGWPLYEARCNAKLTTRVVTLPTLPFPRWQGKSLSGKSLVLVAEQGFGDAIQFVRYAPLLKAMDASRITLVCRAPLIELLRTAPGVDAVVPSDGSVIEHDFWVFLLSLPGLCGTTLANIPASLPYLAADPRRIERWRSRLPASGFRVGLVWKGASGHKNDAERSLPGLSTLAPLWDIPGVSFVSLQKGAGEEEAGSPPQNQPIIHLGTDIQDFADTAAIVTQLDLVICVDTAIAHLAGALGKPCWVLLPAVGTDWRWMHERTDSPWYPGVMRLFRQTGHSDWEGVISRVAGSLRKALHRHFKQRQWIGTLQHGVCRSN